MNPILALIIASYSIGGFISFPTLEPLKQQDLIEFDPCGLSVISCVGEKELKTINATVYAYTSRIEETDSDPFTTASGERVRDGIVANNCLPFGTKVEILGQVYEVSDRMNSRYGCEIFDVWYSDYDEARKFGKRNIVVNVLNSY